jgi:hypothetical protein
MKATPATVRAYIDALVANGAPPCAVIDAAAAFAPDAKVILGALVGAGAPAVAVAAMVIIEERAAKVAKASAERQARRLREKARPVVMSADCPRTSADTVAANGLARAFSFSNPVEEEKIGGGGGDARARATTDENPKVLQFPTPDPGEAATQLAESAKASVAELGKLLPGWSDTLAVGEAYELLRHALSAGLSLKVALEIAVDAARLQASRAGAGIRVFSFFIPSITRAHAKAVSTARRIQEAAATAEAAQSELPMSMSGGRNAFQDAADELVEQCRQRTLDIGGGG